MSYASDLTASLADSLAALSPALVNPSPAASPTTVSAAQFTSKTASGDAVAAREAQLRATLAKLRPSSKSSHPGSTSQPLSPATLAQLVDAAFPPFQAAGATPPSPQTEGIELVTVAQLTIAAYGVVLRTLMDEAAKLGEDDDWWNSVESDTWNTGLFLVQTGPSRLISLTSVTVSRLHQLTTSSLHISSAEERPSLLHLTTWRRALPPSLFLASLFPHLSGKSGLPSLSDLSSVDEDEEPPAAVTSLSLSSATRLGRRTARSLFFLTLSPLALTRQEIAHRRAEIKKQREELAEKIGELTLAASSSELGSHLVGEGAKGRVDPHSSSGLALLLSIPASVASNQADQLTLEDFRLATWSTLRHLDAVLTPPSSSPSMLDTPTPPSIPSDLAHSLLYLLMRTLPSHTSCLSRSTEPLRPPSALTRSWPYLLSVPLIGFLAGRTIYANRQSLTKYALDAAETGKRFVVDWVVEPVRKILETVRGGEGMAIMGRESLRSDLESLERMVVDFGRDEYHLSPDQLSELAEKVRLGDLTPVLKAWEKDIKSPIRSAVTGSLVRTLLIQVQKVKVDVALAMDGIEKMLKSQQLTFGFVGVAPSMLVCVAVGKWVKGLFRRDGGRKREGEERKKCWMVMRQLDLLLSPPRPSQSLSAPLTQGLILLSLSSLRSYAHSRHFPSRDTQLLAAFLEDVRALEDLGARAGKDERKVLLGRLGKWGRVLGWEERIRA
ncbi:hypothetical protein JCM1841_006019 [Sporobolomyces salmonicolor]